MSPATYASSAANSAGTGAGNADGRPSVREGLVTLGPAALALKSTLDATFDGWGRQDGARPMAYPPLMAVADLNRVDYFTNFPHLAVLAGGLRAQAVAAGFPGEGPVEEVPDQHLLPARYVLPPAACYSVYFDLAGQSLADTPRRISTVATCFRREDHFDGLRRLLGFTMREIVCVGGREDVLAHLAHYRGRLVEFAARLGLPVEVRPASDPFFDAGGARALMQRLFPVKEEFVYNGSLAIASVNFHRNFFGERLDIRTAGDGSYAFSGCVAFGLERWISALGDHFGEGPDALRVRIAHAD